MVEQIERRLAAILLADVVGYSSLMEKDEAATLDTLRDRREKMIVPLVAQHSGRIVKFTGDGVLVEFGSAVNALSCALRLQDRMADANKATAEIAPIMLRIGINLGEVVGEGSDIYGDGVNVAARLEGIAQPGGICISGKVYDEVVGKVAFASEDAGEVALKNISRPIRVWNITSSIPRDTLVTVGVDKSRAPHLSREKQSIAVLPFVNMTGEAENEYLCDGLTDDIITALSRSNSLAVIARTSTFTFKGSATEIRQIAKDLDVGFVLEGSVRKVGARIRVNAQLIDAASGVHVWADKFDAPLEQIWEVQDQITACVASATQVQILSAGERSPRGLHNIASPAYRLALRGIFHLYRVTTEELGIGAALAEEALAFDHDCSLAHYVRATAFVVRLSIGEMPHSPDNVERALFLAREALRRSPNDEWCHWILAYALSEAGRFEEALAEADIGIKLNPNAAMILADKGDYLVMLGRPAEAIPLCQQALRLNPRDPLAYWWENCIATAHFISGEAEQALLLSRRVALRKPDHARALIIWTAAAGALDRSDEAAEALRRCQTDFPALSLASAMPHYIPAFRRSEDRDRLLRGLKAAGMK